ncbi:Abi family protein [Halarcobacter sp.]|uniref:Abi family protein n=1 Tax=Halarcobacter sp. TaxID=2321133 RepID=UPI002AAABC02|nr:Abi family protein [Halarcobacter sp.]
MSSYNNSVSTTKDYLKYLYSIGFNKSKYLTDDDVVNICDKVGVFKFKGYVKEVKHLSIKNIDDVLVMYFFDKYFSKILFDLTSRIESKLKSILVTECYKRTNNHFFYLINANHKWTNFKIDFPTLNNWKKHTSTLNPVEAYSHYILYYLQNYDFIQNQKRYLGSNLLINNIDSITYNYPPFKYLIESASLGNVISFIESLKLRKIDINKQISPHFGVGKNTRIFKNYLERLNEVRNRVAHGGRIFNRTFRSATGVGKFYTLRASLNNHKSLDIYLFLFYMLNELESLNSIQDFKKYKVKKLFRDFKKDYISNIDSLGLVKKYKRKDFENIEKMIFSKMSR